MTRGEPKLLTFARIDAEYLVAVADRVLGSSDVAATNAVRLRQYGFDPRRLDLLLPWDSVAVRCENFVLKKVEADPETPDNFGLFVRRVTAP